MTIDLTNRFTALRLQSQKNGEQQSLLNVNMAAHVPPTWKALYVYIKNTADDVSFYLKKLEQKRRQIQMTDASFKNALEREIYFAKDEVLGKLREFYVQLQYLEKEKETSHEARLVVPAAIACLKQMQAENAAHFRRLQIELAYTTQRAEIDYENSPDLPQEARYYYMQAKMSITGEVEEIKTVVRYIDEIVDIIYQMAGKVYETGTLINRIDQHVLDAKDMVEQGVNNLEKARSDQKKVSCLRSFTYTIYLADLVMCVVYCILKA